MFKKRIAVVLIFISLITTLSSCGRPTFNEGITIRVGHVLAPDHPYTDGLKMFAKLVSKKTNGKVTVDVFHSSQLGDERDMIEGLQLGTLEMALVSTAPLSDFTQKFLAFDLPFIFKDAESARKVVDGPIGNELFQALDGQQIKGLAYWENGFRSVTNNKRPIETPEDMKGLKIRTMENPVQMANFKSLGASPSPMAFGELFTALQQKTIDGQENPLPIVDTSKFYEVQDYLSLTAMGSHGGATAEGQLHVLDTLGITEESMGCPIESSMEVVQLGSTESGVPVYFDKYAYSLDGIVVVNRVKPHTDFDSDIESGLTKMIAVGLGNQKGCSTMHSHGLRKSIPESAKVTIEKANILFGLGIIENAMDETCKLKALLPEDFEIEEKKLLREAKETIPRLPIDELDVLVVEEMGKMISGTGMDTKVLGRIRVQGEKEPLKPVIKKVVVLDLANNSYGNALGIGLADVTTKKLVDSIDFEATYANIISTTFLERGKIPVTVSNDKNAIIVGLNTVGNVSAQDVKIGIIKNTLDLKEMYLSEGAIKDTDKSRIRIIRSGVKLMFDTDGNLKL